MSVPEQRASFSCDSFISLPAEDVLCSVRPSRENNASVRATVRKVADALQSLGPAEVIKGGSYGKGTQLRGRDEVDLVVLFRELNVSLKPTKLADMQKALGNLVQEVKVEEAALSFKLDNVALIQSIKRRFVCS